MQIEGIDRLVIGVRDMDRALRFFGDVLGVLLGPVVSLVAPEEGAQQEPEHARVAGEPDDAGEVVFAQAYREVPVDRVADLSDDDDLVAFADHLVFAEIHHQLFATETTGFQPHGVPPPSRSLYAECRI